MEMVKKKLVQLKDVLHHCGTMLIVLQDHPDPDAIASAVALRKLANTFGSIQCSFAHGGTVGRAENRALVKYLGLNLRPASQINFHLFDLIAMLDTQPGTGNNSLPDVLEPDIVIDHHPCRKSTRHCRFTDIRSRYGATSTILTEYLMAAGIEIETTVATALLYGIRSDTQDLGRDTTSADIAALMNLYPLANLRMLSQIQRGKVQRGYYGLLSRALNNAKVYGKAVLTNLEEVENPDMIGEMADLLLRDDVIEWTMCYGFYQGKILISLRTEAVNGPDSAKVIRAIIARKGTGGGHYSYAGGQIPIKGMTKKSIKRLLFIIERRFIKQVEPDKIQISPQKLVD